MIGHAGVANRLQILSSIQVFRYGATGLEITSGSESQGIRMAGSGELVHNGWEPFIGGYRLNHPRS